jgi:predicted GH43/DUF377 family glycosyl hydrolase
MNLKTGKCLKIMEDNLTHPQTSAGYEDVRVFRENEKWKFFASSYKNDTTNHIWMVYGDYDTANEKLHNTQIIESPFDVPWEKNWLHIPGTDHHIYEWSPLRIGTLENGKWKLVKQHNTSPFFSLFRGSAPPIELDEKWVALVHVVEYSVPVRKYYHVFVELEKETYKPLRVSLPFVFQSISVEYCISMRLQDKNIQCIATYMDSNPSWVTIKPSNIQWIQV